MEEGSSEGAPKVPRKVLLTQESTVWTRKQHAVCVRRAIKRYGTKKCPTTILNDLNMTVPRGKIYGLLGASGCGKTTLLSCIVGRRRLNSGEIWVLGGRPGSRGSGVPGPRIGYMPQEIALYGEFSIQETLTYFGWISGLTTVEVKEKLDFLIKFLMLPTPSRLVKNLSGGQQRRVSFAAALLHDPELLILDEPTVGVDPVLRQNIWDHLVEITKDGSRTVIITTHYIEETRQAGMDFLEMHDHGSHPSGDSFAVDSIAGSTAGIIELCLMYPIDTVKTRLQSLESRNLGIVKTLIQMIKTEGAFRPMKGIGVIAAVAGPAHGLYFASYQSVKEVLLNHTSASLSTAAGIAGAVATVLHDLMCNPAEVIKQRLQMKNSPYKSTIDCAVRVFKDEGLSAFYRSFGTQLLMNIPFQMIHFVTYELCYKLTDSQKRQSVLLHFTNGAVAGGIAAAVTTPLDVCKTLLNTQQEKVVGVFGAIKIIYRTSGPSGFFKGIGLMRGGRFLAEDSPENLMRQYNTDTLEEVFLKLSVMQNMNKRRRSSFMQELIGSHEGPDAPDIVTDNASEISGEYGDVIKDDKSVVGVVTAEPLPPEIEPEMNFCDHFKFLKSNHMKALIWKNFLWMWRNVGVMLFVIGLPVIECIIFCLSIGHDPQGLKFAVFNNELNHSYQTCDSVYSGPVGEGYENLGCMYLNHLAKRNVQFIDTVNEEDAIKLVEKGHAWGALEFSKNYSESLTERANMGRHATEDILQHSDIWVTMDMSNQQIGQLLSRDVYLAFADFLKDIAQVSNVSVRAALPPIQMHDPIYGDRFPNFTDFAAPGVILTVIFFLSVALTSGAILMERNEGLLERSLVLGITGHEILLAHVVTQFVVMVGQSLLVLIFTFGVFHLTMRGNIFVIFILVILTGLCGMTFGFVVSCSCENERSATYMALGSFLPIVMLCGIIWPIEGMHFSLKFISLFLPLTKSTESLRSMLQRGWEFSRPTVYFGFLSTLAWIGIFMTISVFTLKFKKG